MKNALKIIAFLLIFTMVLVTFACKTTSDDTKPTEGSTTNGGDNSEDTTKDETKDDKTAFPYADEKIDWGGKKFTILSGQEWSGDTLYIADYDPSFNESESADVLDAAIFRRNQIIAEMYNLEFDSVQANEQIKTKLKNTINSNIDEYDAVVPLLNHAGSFASSGYAVNIYNTALTLDAPWWDQHILKTTSISGAAYYIVGDIFTKHYDGLPMLMFNKKLLAELQLETPYNYVNENQWTIDKFNEMVKGVYVDIDQNGKHNRYDRYGFATQCDYVISFVNGCGQLFADKDENDLPVFVGYTDKLVSIMDKVMDHYAGGDTYCIHRDAGNKENGWSSATSSQTWVFPEGRALFYWGMPRYIGLYLRDMEDDFGIVPIPKWDSNQDRYYSTVNGWNSYTLMIPKTVTDVEKNSIILDAMAYYGLELIKPAYYDVTLQRKHARDEESAAMLDIIFSSLHYETPGGGTLAGALCNEIQKGSVNLASLYEKNAGKIETEIQDVIDAYESNID